MPAGLPTPVRREWRRVVAELAERDPGSPMPAADVLADYCRTLVRQRELATVLENAEPGTVQWSRLSKTEEQQARRIAKFCSRYFAAAPVDAPAPPDDYDHPFGPADPVQWRAKWKAIRRRQNPHLRYDDGDGDGVIVAIFAGEDKPESLASPECAAMVDRWGPPLWWRGRRLQLLGARDDAKAIEAWAEFERSVDDDDWPEE
jgi:hypothetical protein